MPSRAILHRPKSIYAVVTFDRNGNEVDETPVLHYYARTPGFNVQGGQTEPFYYSDLPGNELSLL